VSDSDEDVVEHHPTETARTSASNIMPLIH